MTQLTWNHARTVGVRAMDDQHGILMDTMNELRLSMVRGSGQEAVSELLARLTEFTRMHFHSEEVLLERTGFPGLAEHRAAHQHLLRHMGECSHRAQHGEHSQMHPLLCFLRDVYLRHMETSDRIYGPWLNERGVD